MIGLYIFLGLIGIFVLNFIFGVLKNRSRNFKCSTWKVDDKLILNIGNEYNRKLSKNNRAYAILKGWSLSHLYIDCGDGYISKTGWSVLDLNKSDYWRKNYEEAKKVMGCEPKFTYAIDDDSSSIVGKEYGGKPIETMNEIECNVYLKKALEDEEYNVAELIRKRLETFR
jgi:hypothetical protein